MDKGKIALGVLSLVLVGLAMGYVVATGFVMFRYGLSPTRFDVTLLARRSHTAACASWGQCALSSRSACALAPLMASQTW